MSPVWVFSIISFAAASVFVAFLGAALAFGAFFTGVSTAAGWVVFASGFWSSIFRFWAEKGEI